jgi:hypothetical protein
MGIGAAEVDCGKLLALELKPSHAKDPTAMVATQKTYLIFTKKPLTRANLFSGNDAFY